MKIEAFLDANVILDFTLKRDHFELTEELWKYIIEGEIVAYTSVSVINIAAHWLTKAYGIKTAKEVLLSLLQDVTIIEMPHALAIEAIELANKNIEDSIQLYMALHNSIKYFITFDKELQKKPVTGIKILSPKEVVKLLK